jgi:hypothetical protein
MLSSDTRMTQTWIKVPTSAIFESEPDRQQKSNADDERQYGA